MAGQIPLVDYLVLGDEPHLVAQRVHELRRPVLRPPQRLRVVLRHRVPARSTSPTEGEVRAFTIVAFAAPGVPVPFVAGVIDCDGTSVRGNVINVEPDPEHVHARHEGAAGHLLARHRRRRHRGRSASASSRRRSRPRRARRSTSDERERRHLDPRDPHDQVRQAPRQGHRRPRRPRPRSARSPTAA